MTLSLRFSRPEAPEGGGGRPADDLTGLEGRAAFREHLEALVLAAARGSSPAALLLVDIDRFHQINHAYGQSAGDEVLRTAARLLQQVGDGRTSSYRCAGDQFALVLDRAAAEEAVAVARAAFMAVNQAVSCADRVVPVSASVAVVIIDGRRQADDVMRDADVTVFATKAAGGHQIYMYSPELDAWAEARRQDMDSLATEVEKLRSENRLLAEFVHIDPVSGLGSPAAFQADHDQADARRRRTGDPYCLIVVDLDWFFDFGERYGTEAAERAVMDAAGAVTSALRPGERAYRLGHDDFAVLLPGTRSSEAVSVAEGIRVAMEGLALPHAANPWGRLTATVGVVEAGFRHSDHGQVLAEAADMVRTGKEQGRNRIAWPH